MDELRHALDEIAAIRGQMARAAEFRGYGPAALAATAGLALMAAWLQPRFVFNPARQPSAYAWWWAGAAALAAGLIAAEAIARSRRLHAGLADEMIRAALEQFLPSAVAGLAATIVIVRWAPAHAGLLPGFWQIVFGLGVFASCRILPRPLQWVGAWYLATGLVSLAAADRALAPWMMGGPFALGQALAAVLLFSVSKRSGDPDAEEIP